MRARVIGIDGGLARTGIGELTFDGHRAVSLTTRLEKSHPPADPSAEQTAHRMSRMIRASAPAGARHECGECGYVSTRAPEDLVMVMLEGPAYGVKSKYAHEGAGYWWRLRSILAGRGIPVGICNPVHLKLWATGKGRCTDDELKWALDRMWPGVLASDTDQVDGGLLALIAAQRLGWFTGDRPLIQAPILAKMTWPKLPEQRPVPVATS